MVVTRVSLLLLLVLLTLASSTHGEGDSSTECGGVLRSPKGVITTPNFPGPYPVPITCRWVIEAPADKVIGVYFTQFYMREGLRAAEYAFYAGNIEMGKTDFGEITSEQEPAYLLSNKPVLVLEFSIPGPDTGNAHLRVRDFFLDVYGFNVTYEVLNKTEGIRRDPCIYHKCSYTGKCLATSPSLEKFECLCFPEYYGPECQYNPSCGPNGQPPDMCFNGGTCRYYIGSTIRTCECPEGFTGARCEKPKDQMQNCLPLRCSHNCTLAGPSEYRCSCPSGFYLAEDKETCVEEGRTKYWIYFRLYDHNIDLEHMDPATSSQLKKGVENAMEALLKRRLYKVDNLTIFEFQNEGLVKFGFYGEKEDHSQVRSVMEDALRRGRIGNYAVNRTYVHIEWEPALMIQRVEVSEELPVVAGTELSIACIVQGGEHLTVEWLRDGAPINVHTPYRSLWTARVPRNSRDQLTALLGFDATHTLDTGEFTCKVSENSASSNATVMKSVQVKVASAPQPRLTPLTATVTRGSPLVVTCLSQDDVYGNFGYTWLKNGKVLAAGGGGAAGELVEDLFPAGSRVVVRAAGANAVYTCIIGSKAGSTHRDSIVTVIDSGAIPTCSEEEYVGVKWNLAAANTGDIQLCPNGYSGVVTRKCALSNNGREAIWEEPDFSNCLSAHLLKIKEQFETLRMGYLITSVHTVLEHLVEWLFASPVDALHSGEGEPVVDLLGDVVHFHQHQPNLISSLLNNTQLFLDVASFLLESSGLVQRQSHILRLHDHLLDSGLLLGRQSPELHSFIRPAFVLEVGTFQPSKVNSVKFPHLARSVLPSWLTDAVELYLDPSSYAANETITTAVIFYKNITRFFPHVFFAKQGEGDLQYQLHSQPVGLALVSSLKSEEYQRIKELPTPARIRVKMPHVRNPELKMALPPWNISCGIADFASGEVKFVPESCQLMYTHNFSVCHCHVVGTYSVLLTAYNDPNSNHYEVGFDVIVGIGCGVTIFLSCLTLFIIIILWRKVPGAISGIKIQVCLAIIATYILFLKSIHGSLPKAVYPHVVSFLQLFLLAGFGLQLCVALLVYVELASLKSSLHFPRVLVVPAIGWVVPMIVVGATLAAQVLEGFVLDSWWLTIGSNYFYAYISSAFIIVTLQLLLFLTVRAEIRHHQQTNYHSFNIILTRQKLLNRSLIISLNLILVSVSSILFTNYRNRDMYRYLFSASSFLMGLVIFASYTFCSEKAYVLCSSQASVNKEEDKEEAILQAGRNSFKSFLKPEIVGDSSGLRGSTGGGTSKSPVSSLKYQIEKASQEMDWKELDQLFHSRAQALRFQQQHSGDGSGHSWSKYEEFEKSPSTTYARSKPHLGGEPRSKPQHPPPLSGPGSMELQALSHHPPSVLTSSSQDPYLQTTLSRPQNSKLQHVVIADPDLGAPATFRTLPSALKPVSTPTTPLDLPPSHHPPPPQTTILPSDTILMENSEPGSKIPWNTTAV